MSNLCPHRFSASVLTKNDFFVDVSGLLLNSSAILFLEIRLMTS